MAYSIGFDIFARDRASAAFDKLGRKVGETSSFFDRHKATIIAGSTAAALAIVGFARTSIAAYTDAEASQRVLTDAYARFPALADIPLQSLRDQAKALEQVTQFDDDATAAAMGHLAAFKLTGSQVQQLTPLLLDYAAKTGKDLPTAANTLGKALLGQGRGLKDVGIKFKDTGSTAGNFAELIGGLRTQVGGFAEKEGKSAEGQAAILRNKFGDLQEIVGSKLVPVLATLATALIATFNWISKNQGKTAALAITVGVLAVGFGIANALIAAHGLALSVAAAGGLRSYIMGTKLAAAGQWLLNAAMSANPIGLVIAAIALLAVGLIYAYKHSETFRNVVNGAFRAVAATARWLWNNVLAPVIRFILLGFAQLAASVAIFLHALSRIPGFGWARTAAAAMAGAAAKARELAAGIRNIPNKTVTVTMRTGSAEQRLRAVLSYLASIHNKSVAVTVNYLNIGAKPAYQTGGYTGRGSHSAVAGIVHKGEYVMDADTVSKYGVGFMDAIRGMGGPRTGGQGSPDIGGGVMMQPIVIQMDTGVVWRGLIKYGRELGFQIVPA